MAFRVQLGKSDAALVVPGCPPVIQAIVWGLHEHEAGMGASLPRVRPTGPAVVRFCLHDFIFYLVRSALCLHLNAANSPCKILALNALVNASELAAVDTWDTDTFLRERDEDDIIRLAGSQDNSVFAKFP